jgi:ABC-2 type transport system permease protein
VLRYARLLGIQLRAAALLALQYRLDFALQAVLALFWSASALVPLLVLFEQRPGVAGWTREEALLVVGFFLCLKGVLSAAVQPALGNVVELIRNGTLDFLLLKPADAQFLVSTSRFELPRAADVLGGLAVVAWALAARGTVPSARGLATAALLLVCAIAILYSIWILVVSLAFYVVKVDNLVYLMASIFDAARWPISIFRGIFAIVFTFVIPLAVMTSFPALALLDRLRASDLALALALTGTFAATGRLVWRRAIGRYTSAGG